MKDNKKVLLIDPWGISNNTEYLNGLAFGLSDLVDLTVITNEYFKKATDKEYKVIKYFFKKSENMKVSMLRTCVRGAEYVLAYQKILRHIKEQDVPYDIIHINWLLFYKFDKIFIRELTGYCRQIVYTAHNVIPHTNGSKSIPDLRVIYSLVDKVILHGSNVKKEFMEIFPEFESKIFIQKHGCNLVSHTDYDISAIQPEIIRKLDRFPRIYIFVGIIFYNKGVDRILKYWLENDDLKDVLLIVAGKIQHEYAELADLEGGIAQHDNILYMNTFVENNLLNYLIDRSNLILLPYRHASMSGVIFTASDFNKPVLCTKTGALEEYLEDEADSFLVENSDEELYRKIDYINQNIGSDQLSDMGRMLHEHIAAACSWNAVARDLIRNCYDS